jgi:hypothetical protein
MYYHSFGPSMHPDFDLVVSASGDALTAELRLLDSAGAQIGYNEVDIRSFATSRRQGLFDLREFVRMYAARPGETGRTAEQWGRRMASRGRRGRARVRGERRLQRLRENLQRAMRDEAILLVLDNFETNLKEKPEGASSDNHGASPRSQPVDIDGYSYDR